MSRAASCAGRNAHDRSAEHPRGRYSGQVGQRVHGEPGEPGLPVRVGEEVADRRAHGHHTPDPGVRQRRRAAPRAR